jgi:hypothetical protein
MAIGKFFKRIFSGIGKLFDKTHKIADQVIPVAIEVVEKIKYVMDSPLLPVLTMLIPGQVDDVIAAKIKQYLPDVLLKLKISNECAQKKTADEIIQCAIAALRQYDPQAQKANFLNIASMLSAALADGKLTWAEIVAITHDMYETKYNQ